MPTSNNHAHGNKNSKNIFSAWFGDGMALRTGAVIRLMPVTSQSNYVGQYIEEVETRL